MERGEREALSGSPSPRSEAELERGLGGEVGENRSALITLTPVGGEVAGGEEERESLPLQRSNLGAQRFDQLLVAGKIRIGGHCRALSNASAAKLDDFFDVRIINARVPSGLLKIAGFGIQTGRCCAIASTSFAVTGCTTLCESLGSFGLRGGVNGFSASTTAAFFAATKNIDKRRSDEQECEVFHDDEP